MQEVLKSASSAFMIRIFGTLLGFSVSVLVARSLGTEGSGIYYLALSVATIAATIGRAGFDNTAVRFIASHASAGEWADVRYTYNIAIRTVAAASLLVSIAIFFSASWVAIEWFNKPFMEIPFQIAAISVLPVAIATIQAESLRGLKYIQASQWIKTVLISLFTLLVLDPFIRFWGADGAVSAYLLAAILASGVSWWLWHKAIHDHPEVARYKQPTQSVKPLFQSSWALFGVSISGLIMQQAATIFLGIWGSAEEIGVFSIGNRIAALLLFPLIAMVSILAPKFSALHRKGEVQQLALLARRSSLLLTAFALPVASLVFISAESILEIFGKDFVDGVWILRILLIGVVINAATGPVSNILMMSGHEKSVRQVTILSSIMILTLCALLIPQYGGVGGAIAYSTSSGLQNIYMIIIVRQRIGFWAFGLFSNSDKKNESE